MKLCHGKGDPEFDGCCYVNGQVCPLRWKIVNGRILEGPDLVDKGTVEQFAQSVTSNRNAQSQIIAQAQGVNIVCSAAVKVLSANPALLNNRAGFNDAWNNQPDYIAKVRPHWEIIEQDLGLAPGSYQCSTWQGTGKDQCCFAETEEVNASKRANLSATAVAIRQAGGKP